jgi:hypothetical protein
LSSFESYRASSTDDFLDGPGELLTGGGGFDCSEDRGGERRGGYFIGDLGMGKGGETEFQGAAMGGGNERR